MDTNANTVPFASFTFPVNYCIVIVLNLTNKNMIVPPTLPLLLPRNDLSVLGIGNKAKHMFIQGLKKAHQYRKEETIITLLSLK